MYANTRKYHFEILDVQEQAMEFEDDGVFDVPNGSTH
jgi:hypothetical protein